MERDVNREVYLNEELVEPGFLYNEIDKKYHKGRNEKNVQCEECPITFKMMFFNMDFLLHQANSGYKYFEDFKNECPVDAIFVRGVKVLEKKGIEVPLDYCMHTVMSVLYKSHVDILVAFTEKLPQQAKGEFLNYLYGSTNLLSESRIPEPVMRNFQCAYIYPRFSSSSTRLPTAKHAFTEFCRVLRESDLSTVPVTAYIAGPRQQCADIDSQLHRLEDGTSSAQVTHYKSVDSTKPTNHSSFHGGTGKFSEKVAISIHNEVPDVHLPQESLKEEVVREENICSVTKRQSLKTGDDEGNKIPVSTGGSEVKEREMTCGNELNWAETNSSNLSTRPKEDRIHHKSSVSHECNHSINKDNYNKYKSSSQFSKIASTQGENLPVVDEGKSPCKTDNKSCYKPMADINNTLPVKRQSEDFEVTDHLSTNIHLQPKTNRSGDLKIPDASQNRKSKDGTLESQSIQAQESARRECNENEISEGSKSMLKVSNQERQSTPLEGENKKLEGDTSGNLSKDSLEAVVPSAEKRTVKKASGNVLQKGQKSSSDISSSSFLPSQPENKNSNQRGTDNMKSNKQRNKNIETEKFIIMKSKLLDPEKTENDPCGVKRYYFGIVNEEVPEKVIILLGASGSGKTTLINFIANYFCDKKSADDELIHVATTLQTRAISAYTFCFDKKNVPITVIDTPGLNDSSGGEIRDHVQSLKTFLANAASQNFHIHAIGFVAQAHLVRLTSSERLVMDYVSKIFGENVSEHFITLITFADTQNNPPVVEAMKNYGVKCKKFLKFNNSALSNGKSDEVDDLDRVYYRTCCKNWKRGLKALEELPALSVNTMKAVQSEIYSTTVTEMAEKELMAELRTFFTCYQKEEYLSKENLKICEQIWELASVVHRLRYTHNFSSGSVESTLIECSEKVCQANHLPPQNYISALSLAPSRSLTVGGAVVIRTMAPLYSYAVKENLASSAVSRNITEWSFCHKCCKEHRMKRLEYKGIARYIPGFGHSADILTLKCLNCSCDAAVHGVSKVQAPLHPSRVLRHTWPHIQKVLKDHSLPSYPVKEEIFLKFLNEFFHYEQKELIEALLKSPTT